jgi:hypothetical protein
VLIRLAIGLPLLAMAAVGLLITTVHGRQSRAFERAASTTKGTIVARVPDESSWVAHVMVRFTAGGQPILARAPVADPKAYDPGQQVLVLYDPKRPEHVLLDKDRYNAETSFLFWAAVGVGGLLPMLFGWWWVRRLRRLARRSGPSFAVVATVSAMRPRPWNRTHDWVTLLPLDADATPVARARSAAEPGSFEAPTKIEPIGSYRLMTGAVVRAASSSPAEVKGNLRPGGLVVARVGDAVAWPSSRLRG